MSRTVCVFLKTEINWTLKLETIEEDDFQDLEDDAKNPILTAVGVAQSALANFSKKNAKIIRLTFYGTLLLAFHSYFVYALYYNFNNAKPLLVLTSITWALVIYYQAAVPYLGPSIHENLEPIASQLQVVWGVTPVRWITYLTITAGIVIFFVLDTKTNRFRLVSIGGLLFYVIMCFLLSTNPAKVRWRPVIWGLGFQFGLGLLVLRWNWGKQAFKWFSDQVVIFLDYTQVGTAFVYGFIAAPPSDSGLNPVFAFTVLQTVIYFGSLVSVMYYLGVMQFTLKRIAWIMQFSMGTTATESLNAAACIFLGQTEAVLLIRPYLRRMTMSELHAVMTAGFACIAGSLFAAYISFGACPSYLLSATVMSAPASLAIAKLLMPETKESAVKRIEDLELPPSEENNVLECISSGATSTIHLVAAIIANLIVFLAILAFINSATSWFAGLVGYPDITFTKLVGYLFFPLALVMGSSDAPTWAGKVNETMVVAELMGTKTVLNEFIAYNDLSEYIACNTLRPRAQMIATYALCGFSNIGSIGIQLGILAGMCPEKKGVFSKIAVRALVAGSVSCFMTACVAGLNMSLCTIPKVASWTFINILLKIVRKHSGEKTLLFKDLGPPPNSSWTDPNWDHIIVARDPIQRFISGYSDICVQRKWCLNWKMNVTFVPFIQNLYRQFLDLDRKGKEERLFLNEYHFWPQSWFCGIDELKLSAMKILQLDKCNPLFADHLLTILARQNVIPEAINHTKHLLHHSFTHNTEESSKAPLYSELYRDKRLLYCLLKMYKNDFKNFNFDMTKYLYYLSV